MNCGTRQQKLHSWTNAVRAAVSRRPLRAAQALCASLRTRIYALEGQVARGAAADEAARRGVASEPFTTCS